MKKNLYYRTVLRRRNVIKETIFSFIYSFCSIPRLLLEVFIRRNFGERYFSFSTAVILACILGIYPIAPWLGFYSILGYYRIQAPAFDIFSFLQYYLTWYLFTAGFVAMCIDRRSEIKRLPSVFDFERFSMSAGYISAGFMKFQPFGKPLTLRQIETLLEPGFFLIIGLALWVLQQHIGSVIIVCSVFYSISYFAAYHRGDNFVMDQIDELICNQELTSSFIDGLVPSETKGVNFYGRRPADPELRRRLVENFIEDTDITVAM